MPNEAWSRLNEHRRAAAKYPLDILVWGPGEGDGLEYKKRCELRDTLKQAGHNAAFSEELIPQDSPVGDPLDEELLQADAAHLIVVMYGSRGTQSETDTLLDDSRFASKALIFIHKDTFQRVQNSVAKGLWQKLRRHAEIIPYTTEELEACMVVKQAYEFADKARWTAYIGQVREARHGP